MLQDKFVNLLLCKNVPVSSGFGVTLQVCDSDHMDLSEIRKHLDFEFSNKVVLKIFTI